MNQFVKLFISSMVIVIFLVIIGTFFYMTKIFNQIGDYHKNVLSNKEIMEKEVEYTQNININFNVANVRLDTSDDNNIHVKLFSDNPDNYKVELEDNVLNISLNVKEKKNIFKTDHLSLISVELPSDSESNITIKGNVGDVYFEEFPKAYANLDLDVSDVTIRDISEVKAKVNVGDINLYKVNNALEARYTRLDNNTNVVAFSGNTSFNDAKNIVETFINTEFSNIERHQIRINKIKKIEEQL